jgi:Flp pilus assembly protein TadG
METAVKYRGRAIRKSSLTRCGERGQILILAALFLTALLGVAGLAIDGGMLYAERRQAQNAADHASQAATYILAAGGTQADAETAALDYAAANGYDSADVEVNIPPLSGEFAGQDDHVEVVITKNPTTFFIHVLTSAGDVSARGVATFTASAGGAYALFANSSNCGDADTLEMSGSDNFVDGLVHSNANIKIPGSNNDFVNGPLTRVCGLSVSGSGNTFDPAAPPADGAKPFPVDYTYASFGCTRTFTSDTDISSISSLWQNDNPSTNILKDNVICSTRKLTLSKSDVQGNVTLVAMQELNISGSNFDLHPYPDLNAGKGVLLFTASSSSSALDVSGSGGSWEGLMVAPNGNAKIQGSGNLTLFGSVMANTIKSISGSEFTIQAMASTTGGPGVVSLVE